MKALSPGCARGQGGTCQARMKRQTPAEFRVSDYMVQGLGITDSCGGPVWDREYIGFV